MPHVCPWNPYPFPVSNICSCHDPKWINNVICIVNIIFLGLYTASVFTGMASFDQPSWMIVMLMFFSFISMVFLVLGFSNEEIAFIFLHLVVRGIQNILQVIIVLYFIIQMDPPISTAVLVVSILVVNEVWLFLAVLCYYGLLLDRAVEARRQPRRIRHRIRIPHVSTLDSNWSNAKVNACLTPVKMKEVEDCVICLMPMVGRKKRCGKRLARLKCCVHTFHKVCIAQWIKVSPTQACPICCTQAAASYKEMN